MNSKSRTVYIEDILEAIENIKFDTAGYNFESFKDDRQARQLVERNLEIISEASRHLPQGLKEHEDKIPWDNITGIGNKLRHDYQSVDVEILWNIRSKHLKSLKLAMERMRKQLQESH